MAEKKVYHVTRYVTLVNDCYVRADSPQDAIDDAINHSLCPVEDPGGYYAYDDFEVEDAKPGYIENMPIFEVKNG